MTNQSQSNTIDDPPWRPWWRWLISGLLAFHVAAVFLPPFAFSTRTRYGTSDLAEWIIPVFRPYVEAAYLDHGYAFFAPNPDASHLVNYKVDYDDGRPSVEGTFPDLATERPRLLYHRHFMLSEHLQSSALSASIASGPEPEPRELDDVQLSAWKQDYVRRNREREAALARNRKLYEACWDSYERHLRHVHGGDSVSMVRIEHRPPYPFEVQILKYRLDDERLYRELEKDPLGVPE
jgi:hypothetical protein